MIGRAALLVLMALAVAGCQSTKPAAEDAKPMTYGDWTVKSSGYVSAEGGIIR